MSNKMRPKPQVSIVIPVYNGANYLGRAIDSALNQTYENCEILVINDGSNDDGATRKLALSYGDQIRYFEKENGGVATALNLGIEQMQGDYFSWLSHDDEYYPQKVQCQIDFLHQMDNQPTILFSDFEFIDADSISLAMARCYHSKVNALEAVAFGLIHGCTVLVPRAAFSRVGLFKPELTTTQDYDMWFRLSQSYPLQHMPVVLVKSRCHDEQQSRINPAHCSEAEDFYLSFLSQVKNDSACCALLNETFFLQWAAFLQKMRYFRVSRTVRQQFLKKSWLTNWKIRYYGYINTNWGNRVGLVTLFTDPARLIAKLKRNRH